MIKILQLALRSMLRFRSYTLINVLGLTLSLVCVTIIFRYVHGEFTVDHFNEKLDRIYVNRSEMVEHNYKFYVSTAYYNSDYLNLTSSEETLHPAIEAKSAFIIYSNCHFKVNGSKVETNMLAADSVFLKIMDYPIVKGIGQGSDTNDAIITEPFAKKLFGETDPIHKTFYDSENNLLKVIGVIGVTSSKSVLDFDILLPLEGRTASLSQDLILLHEGVDYKEVNKTYGKPIKAWWDEGKIINTLMPYKDIYFDNETVDPSAIFKHGNKMYSVILLSVGILILVVGIINYVNIYSVVMQRRNREFGMKKVFGARLYNILTQVITENFIIVGISVLLAFFLAEQVSPIIISHIGLEQVSNHNFVFVLFISLALLLPFIVSIYPVLQYRYSTTSSSIRGIGKEGRGGNVRQGFLLFQYIITIVMLIVSMLFVKQLKYMLDIDLGYRSENIIETSFHPSQNGSNENINEKVEMELSSSPLFTSWTTSSPPSRIQGMSDKESSGINIRLESKGEYKKTSVGWVHGSWFKTFDIKLIDGCLWDEKDYESITTSNVILPESTLKYFGITDYRNAVLCPKTGILKDPNAPEGESEIRIIGVVEDFKAGNLTNKILPIILCPERSGGLSYQISFVPERKQEAIAFLQKLHDEIGGESFSYTFIEDDLANMYKEEQKIATTFSILTAIAIFISMMGLFCMSLFDIQQRYKEIAIRKVNGASVSEIVNLLLKKYIKLLALAFIIASPIAWYTISRYLEDFAQKTSVSWWLFAIALVVTATVSLLTLIYQTHKAANQNPAEVLKSE